MKKTLVALAAALVIAAPSVSQAQAPTLRDCEDATNMLASAFYVDCRGAFSGNINGSADELTDLNGFFGGTWTYETIFTFSPASNSGTVTFEEAITSKFVLGVKAGDAYSYYLYDGSNVAGGTDSEFWETIGTLANPNNGGNNVSHINLYLGEGGGTECEPGECCLGQGPGCPVPEPNSYILMASGLAGLGYLARRRRTQA